MSRILGLLILLFAAGCSGGLVVMPSPSYEIAMEPGTEGFWIEPLGDGRYRATYSEPNWEFGMIATAKLISALEDVCADSYTIHDRRGLELRPGDGSLAQSVMIVECQLREDFD
jgi:hypothetical protein